MGRKGEREGERGKGSRGEGKKKKIEVISHFYIIGEGTYKNHKGAYKFEGGFEEGQRSGAGKVTFEKSKEEVEVFFQQGSLSRPSVDSFPPPPPTPLFIVK